MTQNTEQDEFNIVAIDPGRRKLGFAIFSNGSLVSAGVLRLMTKQQFDITDTIDEFTRGLAGQLKGLQYCRAAVVERMRVYPGRSKGDLNHLLDLQAIGCAVGGKLALNMRLVHPQEWKGSVKKEVTAKRVGEILTEEEREVLEDALTRTPKEFHPDITDSIGIGLFHLERR